RYHIYETTAGYVLLMASEREFWENFCRGVDRMDLFEKWPGEKFADHARNNKELQAELREIFKTKSSAAWIAWSNDVNTPIAPVNTPKTIAEDPQFQDRLPWIPKERLGAAELPMPLKGMDDEAPGPTKAPAAGE